MLMTVFIYINNYSFSPSKQEVSSPSTDDYGDTQPGVVRHKHQHQAVTHEDLKHV